jgi:microcystin-dependent protein
MADTPNILDTGPIPVGARLSYDGATDPPGGRWLIEDGRAISRTTYKAYFDLVGTRHGVGDGSTTFNIADTRGKYIFHKATAGTGSALGATFGSIDHAHDVDINHDHASYTNAAQTPGSSVHTHNDPVAGVTGAPSATVAVADDDVNVPALGATTKTTDSDNPPSLVANSIIKVL